MIDYSQSDGTCLLRLQAPPVNALTLPMLDCLCCAIRRACCDETIHGIIIIGDADHFSAGADIDLFRNIHSRDDARKLARVFQDAFNEIELTQKPILAAIAGKVMGGALELAMACHFRICDGATAFSMPEVQLGINPGAGGTARLPRLIGLEKALKMLLTANRMDATEARDSGLVDRICEKGKLLETARELLLAPDTTPRSTRARMENINDPATNNVAFASAKARVAKERPEIVAPGEILKAVRIGIEESFEAGLRQERESFADCMETRAAQNKVALFFAMRETTDVPFLTNVKPTLVERIAVVGMGSMGAGIVHALIIAGFPVTVLDENTAALEKGVARIRKSLEQRIAKGLLNKEKADRMLGLITTTQEWEKVANADFIIEAVFEKISVKQSVLAKIESICNPQATIATNTSTISLEDLAQGLARPDRLVGMHFFNPAHRMPLIEVIHSPASAPSAIATTLKFAKSIRKTPVLVQNREGFLVSRIFVLYLKEAFALLEEGANPRDIDETMAQFGFPMGPLALIDMAGIDILVHSDEALRRAFPSHGPMPAVVTRLVEMNRLGQKTGAGVYKYKKGDFTAHLSKTTASVVDDIRSERGLTVREIERDEIEDRLILRMVNEAFYILEEGICRTESDIDVAMVLGIGFPDFRGGIIQYAHDSGMESVVKKIESLAEKFGARFSPCELLRNWKGIRSCQQR